MNYYDDTNPLILEQSNSMDPYIFGFALGALFILLIHKYIYNNQ
jgi:hypothetical protein